MHFCSEYGYDYGYDGSSSEEFEPEPNRTAQTKIRKADTNIVCISFDNLISTNQMLAGEPIKCRNCEAIMNPISRENVVMENIWNCEFCSELNYLNNFDLDQIPNETDTNFLIESESKTENKINSESIQNHQKYLFYCIDISASMDSAISDTNEMSRLDAVKKACIENLKELKNSQSHLRVGLVTFSKRVVFYGDCFNCHKFLILENIIEETTKSSGLISRIKSALVSSNKEPIKNILNDKFKLLQLGQNQDKRIKPIFESLDFLENKINSLVSEGATALGPALTFLIGFLNQSPGSQIILCTDGVANVGVGTITRKENALDFYEEIADYASKKGIVVNVITMKGTDCKLALLGKVADRTNGSVNIVRPSELSQEFHTILQNRLVATNVTVKLIVNKYLYIRDDNLGDYKIEGQNAKIAENSKNEKSILIREIGNVNLDTEINFEYGIKQLSIEEKKHSKKLEKMPFQVQISYTMPNGAKALRVVTKCQNFTNDRQKAEQKLNSSEIMWSSYSQKMSTYVAQSSFEAAKNSIKQLKSFKKRNNLTFPTSMEENFKMISNLVKYSKADQMSDEQVNSILRAKKSNKATFRI